VSRAHDPWSGAMQPSLSKEPWTLCPGLIIPGVVQCSPLSAKSPGHCVQGSALPGVVQRSPLSAKSPGHCVQGSHSLERCSAALDQQRALDTVSRTHTPWSGATQPSLSKEAGLCGTTFLLHTSCHCGCIVVCSCCSELGLDTRFITLVFRCQIT